MYRSHRIGLRAGVAVAALFFLCATALMGQVSFLGSFVGLITDTSGGVVPGAKVVITSTLTGFRYETVTNSTGNYTLDNIPTSTYKITVTKEGFDQAVSNEIVLGTQATVHYDAALTAGKVTQKVEVTAKIAALNTENSQLGSVVTRADIAELPMEKSPTAFRYLDSSNQDGGYLGGQRANIGFYSVDGVSAMAPAFGAWSGPSLSMSMDAIQDLTMVTSAPSAEFGDVATVSFSTRSGTNNFHGSGFWDTNNHALDAGDPYSGAKGHGPYRQYFGGSISGPVYIPHLYNGKNRTFFFFEYERFMQPGGYVTQVQVPSAAHRQGDFSDLLTPIPGVQPNPVVIYDPTTYNAATGAFTAFPNNIIPSGRISPVSQKYQGYFPNANFNSGSPDWAAPNFVAAYPNSHPHYYPTIRVDHNLRSGKDMITGRWQFRHQNEDYNHNGMPGFEDLQNRNTTNAYIAETHSFSPTLVNEARIGFSRDLSAYHSQYLGASVVSALGLAVPGASAMGGIYGFPSANISDFDCLGCGLGSTANNGWAENTWEFLDNVTFTHGRHTVKTGFTARHYLVDEPSGDQTQLFGQTGFSQFGTQNAVTGSSALDPTTGFGYASFLLGLPNASDITTQSPNINVNYGTYAAYIQDDWRVTPKLTVNFGLRWEHSPTPVDHNDMRYAFNPANGDLVVPSAKTLRYVNPAWPSAFPIETAAQAGYPARSLVSASQDFGPRLSFAYKLPYKMVVRAGIGVYYSPIGQDLITGYAGGPFAVAQQFGNLEAAPATGSNAVFNFQFPNPYSEAGNPANYQAPQAGGLNVSTYKPYLRSPMTQQLNFTLEKQFGDNTVARVSYRGHHMIEFLYSPDLNAPTICSVAAGTCNVTAEYTPTVYPNYYAAQYGVNGGSEVSHQFEFELQKRYGRGLTFNLSYTHTLVETDVRSYDDWGTGYSDVANLVSYSWNRAYDRGHDVGQAPNRFVGSGVWALPVGKGQRFGANVPKPLERVVGGWETSYVLTMRGGYWQDVECYGCSDPGFARQNGERLDVNRLSDSRLNHPTRNLWFNPAAYAIDTTLGTEGNAPAGTIAGPGLINLDFGLIKTIPIHENMRLKFKASMMNVLNHQNLCNPNTDMSSGDPGFIGACYSNTGGLGSDVYGSGSRQIMLGARFEF